MTIQEHYSLKKYNTFGVEAFADYFVEVSTFTELKKPSYLEDNTIYPFFLSEGEQYVVRK